MKQKNSLFLVIIIVIFLVFVSSYSVANSGYIEYERNKRMTITNDKIKEFEEDVKNKKDVSIKDYIVTDEVDYSNKISNIIYKISMDGNKIIRKSLKSLFRRLNDIVDE